jgi:hypothetical protein
MAKKWIAGAIKNPGGLHRALGVPEGQKIPKSKVAQAAKAGGKLGKMGRLAQTLSGMQRKSTKGSPPKTDAEVMKGYVSLGRGLPIMDGKPHATDNRGEGGGRE